MSYLEKQLDGNVIIITGANSGIGYETAMELARRNATLILACRDETQAYEAIDKITAETDNQNVYFELLDLASLNSVKDFVNRFKSKYKRLDILINNAGVIGIPYELTEDGFETTFQVNFLGHFYMTILLLDILKLSAPSRIINLSSKLHENGKIKWDDLQFNEDYESIAAYAQSKLAIILMTRELANRLKDTGVVTVSLHPGHVKTNIWRDRNNPSEQTKILKNFFLVPHLSLYGLTPREGAETTIYCSLSDEILTKNGSYYSNCEEANPSNEATNPETGKKLWDICAKYLNLNIKI